MLAACLEPDIERVGPYGDVYRDRDSYTTFLAATMCGLVGYEMHVTRLVAGDGVVVAELDETVDTGEGRRRTHEAVVFDLSPAGRIRRVQVFLRKAEIIAAQSSR